jgi:hypothetical protein
MDYRKRALCPSPRAAECDGSGQCRQGRCPQPDEPIPTAPGELEATHHETESSAGMVLLLIAIVIVGMAWVAAKVMWPAVMRWMQAQ